MILAVLHAGNHPIPLFFQGIGWTPSLSVQKSRSSRNQGINQGVQSSQLGASLLEVTKRDGWMYAAVWQQSLWICH